MAYYWYSFSSFPFLITSGLAYLGLVLAWLVALTGLGLAYLLAEFSEEEVEDQDLLFWLQSLGPIKKTGREQLDNYSQRIL